MKVVVVGAGTAGISLVGALIEEGFTHVTWVDPEFRGGAMQYYDGIPSNTKAKNLAKYATHLRIFDSYTDEDTLVNVFAKLDPEKETSLNLLKVCLDRMTKIYNENFNEVVTVVKAQMTKVIQHPDETFEVHTTSPDYPKVHADLLFLCLGADLKTVPNQPHLPRINAYDVMSESKIQSYDFTNDVIEIYGSSHSGVLCLRNLTYMKRPPKKIYHIMNRKALLHAEYDGNFIRHDTIGLKGVASRFGKLYESGEFKDRIVTQFTWEAIINPDTTKVIQVVGFKPKVFSFVSKEGSSEYMTLEGFVLVDGVKVPNLHLMGILSPQIYVDREGERMPAVGVDKFLCYQLQVLKEYKKCEKK